MKLLSIITTTILTTWLLLQGARAQTGNTKYGSGALLSNTSGFENTAYGASALRLGNDILEWTCPFKREEITSF